MSRVRRRDGALELRLGAHESRLLGDLATQLTGLLDRDGGGDADAEDAPTGPALTRLFPAGYRDDPDAAAEFARWTRADLSTAKLAGARDIAAALAPEGRSRSATVTLDRERADRWMRSLTDLRLTLAERLGIRSDDDAPPLSGAGALYWWLGGLQESLVVALDRWDAEDADGAGAR